MPASPEPEVLALLPASTQRLLRTVDAMPDEDWDRPSLLPGWTRAHVVAHLALNAEALAGVLRGVVQGAPVPMYRSQADRDRDIEELARADPGTGRTRLLGASTGFADAVAAVPADRWAGDFERTPGGRRYRAGSVPGMRLREVEVHHADLALAYTPADWPADFAAHLVGVLAPRTPLEGPFLARATDLDRVWECGPGAGTGSPSTTTVSGAVADLGWWLTGRGGGTGLTSESGVLPRIGGL